MAFESDVESIMIPKCLTEATFLRTARPQFGERAFHHSRPISELVETELSVGICFFPRVASEHQYAIICEEAISAFVELYLAQPGIIYGVSTRGDRKHQRTSRTLYGDTQQWYLARPTRPAGLAKKCSISVPVCHLHYAECSEDLFDLIPTASCHPRSASRKHHQTILIV
ncbi:hypothetical protein EVAR_14142_1 [Eumeta japonica]|uniref:Uncharacterized protein n=1 Tax=Eumeta variegata TaxID=151549 RepID=A0A4C1UEP6_EUMVA|nr:hypothetical protein EVAR_14142_1 [Eumeta japonica]